MKILITGHRGFVGRHFTNFYREKGHEVFGVDITADTPREARDFFRKDDIQWDLVIHLAAVVGGRAKIEGDPLSVAVDLSIDAEMWQWAIRTKQPRVVYFSSSAAYPIELQTRENHVQPRLYVRVVQVDRGIPCTVCRCRGGKDTCLPTILWIR